MADDLNLYLMIEKRFNEVDEKFSILMKEISELRREVKEIDLFIRPGRLIGDLANSTFVTQPVPKD